MEIESKICKLANAYPYLEPNDLLNLYLARNADTLSAQELWELHQTIDYYLIHRLRNLEQTREICYERGKYLENYLSGEMWATEEAAKNNLPAQIENARIIVEQSKANY